MSHMEEHLPAWLESTMWYSPLSNGVIICCSIVYYNVVYKDWMAVVKSHTQTVSGISICGWMDRTPSVKHHTVYAYSAVQLAAIQQHTTQTHTLVSGQTASKRFKDLSFSTLHFTCILERNQETNTYLRIHCFFRDPHMPACVSSLLGWTRRQNSRFCVLPILHFSRSSKP